MKIAVEGLVLGEPSMSILSRDPNLPQETIKNPGETDPFLENNDG